MRALTGLICVLAWCSTGCGSTQVQRFGPRHEAREPNCDFEIYTAAPDGSFEELGTVEMDHGFNGAYELDYFKKVIQEDVCRAGGDAAVAFTARPGHLGRSSYVRATILKRKAPRLASGGAPLGTGATRSNSPPPAPATGSPTQSPPAHLGCQYDTQCKGDRVCQDGRCVDTEPVPSDPKNDYGW